MNRFVLAHGRLITAAILLVFAWAIVARVRQGESLAVLAVTAGVVWAAGTVALIVCWPRMIIGGFRRALRRRGLGDGPVPANTIAVAAATTGSEARQPLLATGSDRLLYFGAWLDLRDGPLILTIPPTPGRYFSIQLTEPAGAVNVAYLGTRTTGDEGSATLLAGPRWRGTPPPGARVLALPSSQLLLLGRIEADDRDEAQLAAARAIAERIRLEPLDGAAADID